MRYINLRLIYLLTYLQPGLQHNATTIRRVWFCDSEVLS